MTEHITPIWEDDLVDFSIGLDNRIVSRSGYTMAEVRRSGNLQYKGVFLNPFYNWEIVQDNDNALVAVPQKKHEE